MLLAGGTMTGKQGFAAGLVSHLCDLEGLPAAANVFAQTLSRGGKVAMSVTKSWLNELDGSPNEEVLLKAATLSADVIAGEEAQSRLKPLF